jgi:hypothetical protein
MHRSKDQTWLINNVNDKLTKTLHDEGVDQTWLINNVGD